MRIAQALTDTLSRPVIAIAVTVAFLVGGGLTAPPASASSMGIGYRLKMVSRGVQANCAIPSTHFLRTVSWSPPDIWYQEWTDGSDVQDLEFDFGHQNGFNTADEYAECDASTGNNFDYVYYGHHMVTRKMEETLECLDEWDCAPLVGPIYYGWVSGWYKF